MLLTNVLLALTLTVPDRNMTPISVGKRLALTAGEKLTCLSRPVSSPWTFGGTSAAVSGQLNTLPAERSLPISNGRFGW